MRDFKITTLEQGRDVYFDSLYDFFYKNLKGLFESKSGVWLDLARYGVIRFDDYAQWVGRMVGIVAAGMQRHNFRKSQLLQFIENLKNGIELVFFMFYDTNAGSYNVVEFNFVTGEYIRTFNVEKTGDETYDGYLHSAGEVFRRHNCMAIDNGLDGIGRGDIRVDILKTGSAFYKGKEYRAIQLLWRGNCREVVEREKNDYISSTGSDDSDNGNEIDQGEVKMDKEFFLNEIAGLSDEFISSINLSVGYDFFGRLEDELVQGNDKLIAYLNRSFTEKYWDNFNTDFVRELEKYFMQSSGGVSWAVAAFALAGIFALAKLKDN